MPAVPSDRIVGCASGGVIAAGRHRFAHNALLDLISEAPSGSWLKPNTNTLQSVWPATDYLPMFGGGPGVPDNIIRSWSGFAWDSRNHRLVLTGGGHANYSGNEVYLWDAATKQWSLAYYPSDVVTNATGYQSIDGPLHSPVSAHPYCTNVYLPKLDRFLTFGGAAHGSGGPYLVTDGSGNTVRMLPGGYTLNLAQAGQGKVGGLVGSNVKRNSTVGVDLPGANAWYPRDWLLDHPQAALAAEMTRHINFHSVYREEGGKDVLYVTATNGGTNPNLYRVEYNDPDDYLTDVISKVGLSWDNSGSDCGGDIDITNNVFVHLGNASYPIFGWDLDHAGPSNHNFRVAAANLSGPDAAEFLSIGVADFGLTYDKVRGYFVAWERGGKVFSITTPIGDPLPVTGWYVEKIADPSTPRPALSAELGTLGSGTENDTGVHGKWHYAPDLDCYIGLQGSISGNIWMFKPTGWHDPRNG